MRETEEKMKLILKAMEGMTYLEWTKLRLCIDISFKANISTVTNKLPLADADQIIKTYHREF